MIPLIFVLIGQLYFQSTQAASLCNAGGADPLMCKSQKGDFAFAIHPRFNMGDISHNGFCNDGYLKINQLEINGSLEKNINPNEAALSNTQSTSSSVGILTRAPNTKDILTVSTRADFEFNTIGIEKMKGKVYSWGSILVSKNSKTANLYLSDSSGKIEHIQLNCE